MRTFKMLKRKELSHGQISNLTRYLFMRIIKPGAENKREEEMGKEVVDKEDERREAAIASTAALRPNYKPKGLTQHQLSKFQELHRKRLQIKSKSKFENKPKAGTGKSDRKNKNGRNLDNQDSSISVDDSAAPTSESHNTGSSSVIQQEDAPKKRQKLHWGLDTKERWERKANM